MDDEPLKLLPVEKWSELQEVFKSDWPRSISGFTVLETEKYFLQCGLDYGFKVYCPFGDVHNGMVAINMKKTYYEVIVQCASDDTSKLEVALKYTNLVNWYRQLEIPFAPEHIMKCLQSIIEYKKLEVDHITTTTTYILESMSPLFNVILPPGYTFEHLSLEHVNLLDSTWDYGHPDADFYFELLIKAKMAYGLFRDKRLISWVVIKEMGALSHLYTIPEERRKGHAELVLKLISNVLLKDSKPVVAFCVTGNDNAAKLYQKLYFKRTIEVHWCNIAGRA